MNEIVMNFFKKSCHVCQDMDEMVGWHYGLNGHEFEQAPEDGEGQGSLACCSPWDRNELDVT